MPLYEVQVRQISTVTYVVGAKDKDEAAKIWGRADFEGEFVEEANVLSVTPYDDRFDDEVEEQEFR